MSEKPISLYIHIPFCASKCRYCDFNSYPGELAMQFSYFNALKSELEFYIETLKEYEIQTVFFGGGTPSIVNSTLISEFLLYCNSVLNIAKDAEISLECNPGTVNQSSLSDYIRAGVNRLSFGLQSAENDLLERLGRIHTYEDFVKSYQAALDVGFCNINIDLMIGIPFQTFALWKNTLEKTVQLKPGHISCYGLIVEPGTPFYEEYHSNRLTLPDEETERKMYHYARHYLNQNDYLHYEISNWAKAGMESKHNIVYWKAKEYLGLGAGASSYFNGKRYANISDIKQYIKAGSENSPFSIYCSQVDSEKGLEEITVVESMKEFCLLGLRLTAGIDRMEFHSRYGVDVLEYFSNQLLELKESGLIEIDNKGFRLTLHGLDFANQAFVKFI